jgi:hypothetical protein
MLPLTAAYAKALAPETLAGGWVLLKNETLQTVSISEKAGAWNDSDIFIRVPNRTPVEVLGFKKFRLVNQKDLIRYQIRVHYQEQEYTGWVHASNIDETIKIAPPKSPKELPIKNCEDLAARYNKHDIARVFSDFRNGRITIEVNGQLIEKSGDQDPQVITPRSICANLAKSGMSLEKVPEHIRLHQQKAAQAARQQADRQRRLAAALNPSSAIFAGKMKRAA